MSSDSAELNILLGQIDSGLAVLARITRHLDSFLETEAKRMGRDKIAAVVVADALCRYYTAAETIFVRIARFFENTLGADRWHADLLDRMGMAVPGIRPPVLTPATQAALGELLRFRHFSRYYVELEYDWDRLDFLLSKYAHVRQSLPADIMAFRNQLSEIIRKGARGKGKAARALTSDF